MKTLNMQLSWCSCFDIIFTQSAIKVWPKLWSESEINDPNTKWTWSHPWLQCHSWKSKMTIHRLNLKTSIITQLCLVLLLVSCISNCLSETQNFKLKVFTAQVRASMTYSKMSQRPPLLRKPQIGVPILLDRLLHPTKRRYPKPQWVI